MKVMLVFPPQSDVTMPGLALPCLTAALRNAGHEVIQKDINLESFDSFLTRQYLEKSYEYICTRRKDFIFSGTDPRELDRLIQKRQFLMDEVENAKMVMRDPREFYDHTKYMKSIEILEDCLRFISLGFYRTQLTFYSYVTAYSCNSTKQILEAVKNEYCNPYIDFYRENTIPYIISEAPKVLGISIAMDSQVIPALTLAYMVKQTIKEIHIEIGGSYFTNFEENLKDNYELFSLFDSVILNEGETAITDLVNCLEKGLPLSNVPNLIYKDGEQIIANDNMYVENIKELLTPDFDGLPLTKYFSPELMLPLYSSKGCYWRKCTFCSFCFTSGSKYRIRPEKKVIEDIKKLKNKYNCSSFVFVDDAISPACMENLADEILKSGESINWFSFARFEKNLDYDLCNKLSKAGCRVLTFGFESACDRVLKMIDKGTDVNTMREILKTSSKAGIVNYVSLIFGFPSETIDETKETIQFILDNIDNIHWIRSGHFSLIKHSLVQQTPDNYKIRTMSQKPDFDLSLAYDYEVVEGITQKEAQDVAVLFDKISAEFKNYLFNYHLLLYSVHNQTNDILWATASEDERLMGQKVMREKRLVDVRNKAFDLFKDL